MFKIQALQLLFAQLQAFVSTPLGAALTLAAAGLVAKFAKPGIKAVKALVAKVMAFLKKHHLTAFAFQAAGLVNKALGGIPGKLLAFVLKFFKK